MAERNLLCQLQWAPSLARTPEAVPGSGPEIIDVIYFAPERRVQQITDAVIVTSKRGQGWAIFLAVVSIIAAIVFFALGNNFAGGGLLGPALIVLVGAFFPMGTKRS